MGKWDRDFMAYVAGLKARKPVVVCGDLNCAHQEIDLHSPKTNLRSAGFTIVSLPGKWIWLVHPHLCTARFDTQCSHGCHGDTCTSLAKQEERESFTSVVLGGGLTDAFRRQHPEVVAYTYFGYRMNMRCGMLYGHPSRAACASMEYNLECGC